jgi:SAM-dependent methyltransferase
VNDTGNFYDRRGARALAARAATIGSESVPSFLAEPYEKIDDALRQLRSLGKIRFLDLCCGTGKYSVFAAQLGYDVTGIDISPLSIAAAVRLADAHGVSDRCRLLVGDALTTVGNEVFDVIFVGSSLYYLDLRAAINYVYKHLDPAGQFICIETNGDNSFLTLYRRLRARLRADRDAPTLSRLLGKHETAELRGAFAASRLQYYGFLTLAASAFTRFPSVETRCQALARSVDRLVLNRLGLHSLAFKFVFFGRLSNVLISTEDRDDDLP